MFSKFCLNWSHRRMDEKALHLMTDGIYGQIQEVCPQNRQTYRQTLNHWWKPRSFSNFFAQNLNPKWIWNWFYLNCIFWGNLEDIVCPKPNILSSIDPNYPFLERMAPFWREDQRLHTRMTTCPTNSHIYDNRTEVPVICSVF